MRGGRREKEAEDGRGVGGETENIRGLLSMTTTATCAVMVEQTLTKPLTGMLYLAILLPYLNTLLVIPSLLGFLLVVAHHLATPLILLSLAIHATPVHHPLLGREGGGGGGRRW